MRTRTPTDKQNHRTTPNQVATHQKKPGPTPNKKERGESQDPPHTPN